MPSDVQRAIAVVNQMFSDSYARGDAAGVAALYTTDGQILPPNSEMITGHEPIAGFWQFVMGLGIATVRLDSSELAVQGGMAVEIGRYTLGGADGNTVDTGKYLVVWRNEGGNWRLHWDIWNTSMPA